MQRLAPYQTGLWLAEYINMRCQLCYVYQSDAQVATSTSSSHTWRSRLHHKFNKGLLCTHCHRSVTWLPTPFNIDIAAGTIIGTSTVLPIQAATYYDYPLRQAIRAFKHSEDMTKLPLLVHVLRQLPRPAGCHSRNSVILPMPTTASRLSRRGFDPVTILSAYLSRHWGIPVWRGVQRIDHTISQQGLSRAERLTNLNDAFTLSEPPPVKRILLFDDVATTGASLQALARSLLIDPATATPNSSNETRSTEYTSNLYHLSAYALAHGSASR